jgi:hypothetical protein
MNWKKSFSMMALLLILVGPAFVWTRFKPITPQTVMDRLLDRYMIDSSKFKTPPNAIPLRSERIFPPIDDEKEGVYIGHAQSMAMDSEGLFYVPDDRNDEILIFADDGRFVRRFGRTGEGPGDFLMPVGIASGPDFVLVREFRNYRFQFFSLGGKYRSGFRSLKGYLNYRIVGDRIIGLRSPGSIFEKSGETALIDILDYQGRIQKSFGSIFYTSRYNPYVFDRTALSITPQQEIAIAFSFLPIVRLYSMNGDLVREFRTSSGIIDKTVPINSEMVDILKTGAQAPLGFTANAIFAKSDGIYIAVAAPKRLEILLYDESGKLKEYYFKNLEAAIGCDELFVKSSPKGKRFFILRMYPHCIEEFTPAAPRPGR